MTNRALASELCGYLSESFTPSETTITTLEELLQKAFKEARDTWPALQIEPSICLDFLADKLDESEVALEKTMSSLHLPSLFLVAICLDGNKGAIAMFERLFFSPLELRLKNITNRKLLEEESKQRVWEQLFTQEEPKLAQYAGRGTLHSWLKTVLHREALGAMRRQKKERPLEESMLAHLSDSKNDQELSYLKALYRDAFKKAFQEAIDHLTSRDRNILRLHYLDGLNIDGIGQIYKVHRATAARWLVKIRQNLLEETKSRLIQQLGIGPDSLDSILELLQSQMELTLPRMLATKEPTA